MSYSKKRHIQETNLKLENELLNKKDLEEQLFNKIGGQIKGALSGAQAFGRNVTGQSKAGKVLENPRLQNLFTQLKSRENYIQKQLTYLLTELTRLSGEMDQLVVKNPTYKPEVEELKKSVNTYFTALDTAKKAGEEFEKVSINYTTATTTTPQQGANTQTQTT